jgi:flagellin
MVINTNSVAQTSAGLLDRSSQLLAKSLSRLSSGSKIVSAGDDAAGMATAARFDAQTHRISAVQTNVSNAISFSQTQDGYLNKIGQALQQMSQLTVQAQDATKTDADRALYNNEFQSLAAYISDAATKDFNGVSLFSGNTLNVTTDSEGAKFAMTGISINYLSGGSTGYAASTPLGQVSSVFNGQPGGDKLEVGAASPLYDQTVTPSSTISDFVNFWNSTGGKSSSTYDPATGQLSVTAAPGYLVADYGGLFPDLGLNGTNNNLPGAEGLDNRSGSSPLTISTTLTQTPPMTQSSPASPDIGTLAGAAAAQVTLKAAIDKLAADRATVGTNLNRLSSTSDQLGKLGDNLTEASSRIRDVDLAQESTQLARYNILVQAGTAMLAQANTMPQSVLRLVGG